MIIYILFIYFYTHRWLYVVITTKINETIHLTPKTLRPTVSHQIIIANCGEVYGAFGKGFGVRYCKYTALLVMIHIPYTQKWAAQCNAPLRSGKRAERRYFYKRYGVYTP